MRWLWQTGILTLLLSATVASAEANKLESQTELCRDLFVKAELRIAACSWLLQSGKLGPKPLYHTLLNRGYAFEETGQYDRAIQDYDHVIRLKPNDAKAFYNRGNAYESKKLYDRAILDFDQAIRLKPGDAFTLSARGATYVGKGLYDRAIEDFDQVIRLSPDDSASYAMRGNAYGLKAQYDRAIQDFNRAIDLNPNEALSFLSRGLAHKDKNKFDQAIQDFDQAIQLKSDFAQAFYYRGTAFIGKKLFDRAIQDFERAIDLDANDAVAFNDLAWLQATSIEARFRNGRRAVSLAKKAMSLVNSPDHRDTLAAAYAEAGQFSDAVVEQKRAIEMLRTQGRIDEIAEYQNRHNLYLSGQPFRK